MKFDIKRFNRTKWAPREEAVPVPDLRDFFTGLAEGEVPVWRVRGLTGRELGAADEAAAKNTNLADLVNALAGGSSKEKAKAATELLGFGAGFTPATIKMLHMLVVGSVEPAVDIETAKTICKAWPIEFKQLVTVIVNLTGQGHVPGKSPASGGEAT